MSDAGDDLRRRTDAILEKYVTDEDLRSLVALSLQAEKQARGWCPKCKGAVMVTVNDAKAAVSALETLTNQAKGRPDVAAQGASGPAVVVNRRVEFVVEDS